MKYLLLVYILFLSVPFTNAQTVGVGMNEANDLLRIKQLVGEVSQSQSLMARPFFTDKHSINTELLLSADSAQQLRSSSFSFAKGLGKISLLPAILLAKYNSNHPYGWNDGPMIMAKGLQTTISTGIYAKFGFLSVQLQPEYTTSANPSYTTTPGYGTNTGQSYNSFTAGQSSVRLNVGAISVGASTENLWWGPGQFSSLLMSNNAPGFGHLTFNTTRPVKTAIGSFEWQLVVGKLNEDTSRPYESLSLKTSAWPSDWRYFNGMVFSYQPKFLPGIFIGATRSIHLYHKDFLKESNSLTGKYLPVLGGVFTSNSNIVDSTHAPSDQALSLFMRWLLPNYQAEFYIEYGYNDYKQNMRDLSTNANHASAYIIGFKKIVPVANRRLLDVSGELTQMAQTTSYIVRSAGNWYVHSGVYQGLTYQNQILGAGSGFGNNVQTLSLKRLSGFNYIGIKFQRIQQDPKGPGGGLTTLGMRENQWTDMAYGLLLQQKIKRIVLNAEIQQVASTNYGWQPGSVSNLFAQVRVGYYW